MGDIEKYATMILESSEAEALAESGDVILAMISAGKSQILYTFLLRDGGLERLAGAYVEHQVTPDFAEKITARAYLAAAEIALKEGNIRKAQLSHWMILPGTELRQYLDSENNGLAKRAQKLDNLLQFVNRKYFN